MEYINGLVSIITPAYNASHTLVRTITSVLSQSYSHWEMLIVDDCSTDNTAEIINHFSSIDNRIKSFKTENQSFGPTTPRNLAIANARGQYIAFLDSDDQWFPTKLEHQLPLFSKENNVAIVFSDYQKLVDETYNAEPNSIIRAKDSVTFKRLLKGNCIGNLTGVYDVSKVGKIFLQNVGHEDYVLWLTILKKGFIAKNTQTSEAIYTQTNNSLSGNKYKSLKWTWNIYHSILGFNIAKSLYYFSWYAVKGTIKYFR